MMAEIPFIPIERTIIVDDLTITYTLVAVEGRGSKVHLGMQYENGHVSPSPQCGSGNNTIGTRKRYTYRKVARAITCKKCLAELAKLETT